MIAAGLVVGGEHPALLAFGVAAGATLAVYVLLFELADPFATALLVPAPLLIGVAAVAAASILVDADSGT